MGFNEAFEYSEFMIFYVRKLSKYSLSKKGENYRYELTEKLLEKKKNELQALEQEYRNEKR